MKVLYEVRLALVEGKSVSKKSHVLGGVSGLEGQFIGSETVGVDADVNSLVQSEVVVSSESDSVKRISQSA